MVRRFHRSIYDELDELRASMDYLYQLALEPADNLLLPDGEVPGILCHSAHNLNPEVAEHGDEITVTFDTIRGAGNTKISVDLADENTLKISCKREEERTGDDNGKNLRERHSIVLDCAIPLPCRVIPAGAKMSMRNGLLDIRLKKARR